MKKTIKKNSIKHEVLHHCCCFGRCGKLSSTVKKSPSRKVMKQKLITICLHIHLLVLNNRLQLTMFSREAMISLLLAVNALLSLVLVVTYSLTIATRFSSPKHQLPATSVASSSDLDYSNARRASTLSTTCASWDVRETFRVPLKAHSTTPAPTHASGPIAPTSTSAKRDSFQLTTRLRRLAKLVLGEKFIFLHSYPALANMTIFWDEK